MPVKTKETPALHTFGQLMILGSIVFLVLFAANLRSRIYYHAPNYGFLLWIFLYLAITGAGLLRRKKWAVLLSFASGLAWGAILVTSLGATEGSFFALLFNITMVGLLVTASAWMLRYWHALSW